MLHFTLPTIQSLGKQNTPGLLAIRQKILSRDITTSYVYSSDHVANMFTKDPNHLSRIDHILISWPYNLGSIWY